MTIPFWTRNEDLADDNRGRVLLLRDAIRLHAEESVARYEQRGRFQRFVLGREITDSEERHLPSGDFISFHVSYPETISLTWRVPFDLDRWNEVREDPLEAPLTEREVHSILTPLLPDYKDDLIPSRMEEAFEDHLYRVQDTDYQYENDDEDPSPPREAHPNYAITSSREARVKDSSLLVTYGIRVRARIAFSGERGYPF